MSILHTGTLYKSLVETKPYASGDVFVYLRLMVICFRKGQAYCTIVTVGAVYSFPVCLSLLAGWTGRRGSILAVLMIDSP